MMTFIQKYKHSFILTLSSLCFSANTHSAQHCEVGEAGASEIEKVSHCGGFLEGVAIDPQGGVWVLDVPDDRILKVSNEGKCEEIAKTGSLPNGAKFRNDGKLVIASGNGLLLFDTDTLKLSVLADTYQGEPLGGLNDLSIDSTGGIYFTVPGTSSALSATGKVFYLAKNAKEPQLLADNIAFPNGIALSQDEQIVAVAEFAAKRILAIPSLTAKGGPPFIYSYVYTQGGIGPDGILFDENKQLLAANLGAGEVLRFSAEGKPLQSIMLPESAGNMITNMVIADGSLYLAEGGNGDIWRVPYPPKESCD